MTESAYCPKCGCDVVVQKQAIILSGLYYNQGLEKAGIRDLSGAIDQLKRSLKFNKLNIPARNLLGLIYFETGEVVAALSEWVISKNIQPEHNIAVDYINRLQKDANKLDVINQTIKKYNLALQNCREGHEDVAMIQLKKILVQNPKLIKGYHLLALLHLRLGEYEKARKVLKKAIKIDKTNTTTLRFLREVDEQTGLATSLEPRFSMWSGKPKERKEAEEPVAYRVKNDVVVQPASFKESSVWTTVFNMGIGFLVGVAMVWFLFVPARTQAINRMANETVTEYSSQMATQSAEMTNLKNELEALKESSATAMQQVEEVNARIASYESLIQASGALASGNYTEAASYLATVDQSILSATAKTAYDSIYNSAKTTVLNTLKNAGMEAFDDGDYATAIDQLTKANEASEEPDYEILNRLAHAYRLSGNTAAADQAFQAIIDAFPGTRKAESAQAYQSWNLTEGDDSSEDDGDESSESDNGDDESESDSEE